MSIPLAATAATSAFKVAAACWSRLPCVPHYASARVRVPAGVQAPVRDLAAERAARTDPPQPGTDPSTRLQPRHRVTYLCRSIFVCSFDQTLRYLSTNSLRCRQLSRVLLAAVTPEYARRERPRPGQSHVLRRHPTLHNRSSPRSPRPHEYRQ